MEKSVMERINELVNDINTHGCRIVLPYHEPSPVQIIFDGSFTCAGYIPTYPPVLHLGGLPGHIAITCLTGVMKVSRDKYVVQWEGDDQDHDMMIQIEE